MKFNSHRQHKPFGLLIIIVGLTILILAAGELLIRLLIALGALMIINYGMRMYGVSSMQQFVMRAWFNRSHW